LADAENHRPREDAKEATFFWERLLVRPSRWPLVNNQHQQQNAVGRKYCGKLKRRDEGRIK